MFIELNSIEDLFERYLKTHPILVNIVGSIFHGTTNNNKVERSM